MTAAARLKPSRPEPEPPAPRSFLFAQWEQADQHVPYPFLFFWLARPSGDKPAAKLHHLGHLDFIYSVTGNFIAHLTCKTGVFSRAVLHRESFGFRFMPIQGRQRLMTPEKAEFAIERAPLLQQLAFWEQFYSETHLGREKIQELKIELLLERYRELPWHSLRLERPMRAGAMEPIYRFRKAHSRCEIVVGAESGRVWHEYISEPAAKEHSANPLPS